MKSNDGGPAFPGIVIANPGEWARAHSGMSLRDWFAGMALQGILSNPSNHTDGHGDCGAHTTWAFSYADAMIAEREKEK